MKVDFLFTAMHCISRMEKDVLDSSCKLTADGPLKINPPTDRCVFTWFSFEVNLQLVSVVRCSNTHRLVKTYNSLMYNIDEDV